MSYNGQMNNEEGSSAVPSQVYFMVALVYQMRLWQLMNHSRVMGDGWFLCSYKDPGNDWDEQVFNVV
jgi:hypothetical protein